MKINSKELTFAEKWWSFIVDLSHWEEDFEEYLDDDQEYNGLETDIYDGSLQINEASPNWRLTASQQKFIFDSGFDVVYLYHLDGWCSMYRKSQELPTKPFRSRTINDAEQPFGYRTEVNYIPEAWGDVSDKLQSGQFIIVPDVLERDQGE